MGALSKASAVRKISFLVTLVFLVFLAGIVFAVPLFEVSKTVNPSATNQGEPVVITFDLNGAGTSAVTRQSLDVMLLLDKSGSMGGAKMTAAQAAARNFVDQLSSVYDRVGLVGFSHSGSDSSAHLYDALTKNFTQVKTDINSLNADAGTNTGDAINKGNLQLIGDSNIKVEVLLSDGQPTLPSCGGFDACEADRNFARSYAQIAKNNGIIIYTISLGSDANQVFMQQIADITGGMHFYAPTPSDLNGVFNAIAEKVNNLAASSIVINDVLPAGVDLNSISLPTGCSSVYDANTRTISITCLAGTVSIDESKEIYFTVIPRDSNLGYVNLDTNITYTDYNGISRSIIFGDTNHPQPPVIINNVAPEIDLISNKDVNEEVNLTFTVTAHDDGNDAIILTTSTLPSGATFVDNSNGTGTFSWTPANNQGGQDYNVTFFATDDKNAGNPVSTTITVHDTIQSDTTPPVTTYTATYTSGGLPYDVNTWTNQGIKIVISCLDSESGCNKNYYCNNLTNDCTNWSDENSSLPYDHTFTGGNGYFRFFSSDNADNNSAVQSIFIKVDQTAPTVSIISPISGSYLRGVVEIDANALDTESGVKDVNFYHSSITPTFIGTDSSDPYSIGWDTNTVSDGTQWIYVRASDNAGNFSGYQGIGPVTVDNTPPELTVPSNITAEATSSSGVVVSFSATATDNIDSAPTVNCVLPSGSIFALGINTVNCSATDTAGNSSIGSFTITVQDTSAPVISGTPSDMYVEATDASGAIVTYTDPTASDAVDGAVTVNCSPASGTVFGFGNTTVTCTAIDSNSNTATTSFVVTVQDTTPPSITVPSDLTTEAEGAGTIVSFTATATDLVDGPTSVTCVPASGTSFSVGTTLVTCTSTDITGNTGSESFNVIIQDTNGPTLTLPANITAEATSSAGADVNFIVSASDIVDGSITPVCDATSGSVFPLGLTTVSCTATDSNANTSSGSFTITVQDTSAPVISGTPSDMYVEATDASGAIVTYTDPTASDAVDGAVTVNCSPASGTVFGFGNTTVTCTAIDSNSNTATTSFVVTVQDTTPPSITVPSDLTTEAEGAGTIVSFTATATDLVDGPTSVTCVPASGTSFSVGTTLVTCTSTDITGNTGSESFNVIIQDTNGPTLTLPANITAEATSSAGADVNFIVSASDIVDGSITPVCDATSGSVFPLGLTTVSCTATDSNANTSSGSFTITVQDTSAPVISGTPSDMYVEATDASGAIVTYTDPTASDAVDGAVTVNCSPASGTVFGFGNTTVTCTAIDSNSNTATTSFVVTVQDTTPPSITVPSDLTTEAEGAGTIVSFTATATDLVDGPTSVTCVPASGTSFSVGTTLVTCTSTDITGNTGSESFNVIIQDTNGPTLTLPANITAEATSSAGADVNFIVSASDIVDGSITPVCDATSGSVFPLGLTTVSCTATDSNANTSSGSFTITVQDTSAPVISGTPSDMNVEATDASGAIVTYTDPTASDAVDGAVTVNCSPASGTVFGFGNTTVTCTAIDSNSNTATTSFVVNVQDTTAPLLSVPVDFNVEATGPSGAIVDFNVTATDAVDPAPIVLCSQISGATLPIGTTIVDCNATDATGNVSLKSFTIIVQDTTPPVMGTLTATVNSRDVNLSFSATDVNGSGVNHYEVRRVDNNWLDANNTAQTNDTNYLYSNFANGTYWFYVRAVDNSANTSIDLNVSAIVNVSSGCTSNCGGGGGRTGGGGRVTPPVDQNKPVDQNAPKPTITPNTLPILPPTPDQNLTISDNNVPEAPSPATGLFGLGPLGGLIPLALLLLLALIISTWFILAKKRKKQHN